MSRIIAGSHKGRRLATPSGDATRPTSDRVREAVFSVLASELGRAGDASQALAGCGFLDLYAGSGAVAFEAASRGASPVLAVESDRRAVQVIRRNIAETGLPVRARALTVEKFLVGPPSPFTICWLDPPYAVTPEAVETVLAQLADGWLAPGAIVAVERSSRSEPVRWPARLGERWERRYGETTVHFATEGDR